MLSLNVLVSLKKVQTKCVLLASDTDLYIFYTKVLFISDYFYDEFVVIYI